MDGSIDGASRVLSPGRALSQREREVLATVVLAYIQTGVPVASRTVAKTYKEGLSPATIRSIMADLEEFGYITHPHTSAGRIPTDLGYRFYVDEMKGSQVLAAPEQRSIAENLYATGGLDSLVARCCRLLAATSHQVAVGTAPEGGVSRFRHVELVKLNDERLLVLLVTTSGVVQQKVVESRIPESQAEVARYARYLNTELEGRTLSEVRDHVAALMRQDRVTYDELARRALQLVAHYFVQDAQPSGELYVDGTQHLLEMPDLTDLDRMKSLVQALEEKSRIVRILNQCLDVEGVVTSIGSETDAPELAGCAVVATSYRCDDERVGTLGIIGPTRMDYDRAMALVDYIAKLLGSAMGASRT